MDRARPSRALWIVAIATMCSAWPAAFFMWSRAGEKAFAASVFLLGLSLGPCLTAYGLAPRRGKQTARQVVLLAGGLSILVFAIPGAVHLDLEGFFMLLLLRSAGAAIGHTVITLIAGPLVFGRVLCGWGCWRAMVLELLPIERGSGRRLGRGRLLPYAGLAASFGAAAILVFLLGQHPGGAPGKTHAASLTAGVTMLAVYYSVAIAMAFALHDRRAFCKRLCPSSVILRITSRPAVLKMTPASDRCNGCGACSRVCPMDIDVALFAARGRRVASGDCILCQRCAQECPRDALRLAAR